MKIRKSVKSIKIALAALVITAMVGGTTAFAATYYHDYGFANKGPVNLSYWKDSSVAAFGYTSLSNTGLNSWKSVSSNLKIKEVTSEPRYFGIVTYVRTSIPGIDVIGLASHWTYSSLGWKEVKPDAQRDRTTVTMDHTNLQGMSNDHLRQYVFTHEFGHAVGLKHNNSGAASVMSETAYSSRNMPQTADMNYIKQKYGN